MALIPYADVMGSLMYCMVCSRPDIACVVSVLSRYMSNPGKSHWEGVKWLLRYMKGSLDIGLVFKGNDTNRGQAAGYVDSDYARDWIRDGPL